MRRGKSGQITVFMALLLAAVVCLVSTCGESARYEALRLRCLLASEAGAESVFAQYDSALWSNYGLLFFACGDSDFAELDEEYLKYVTANASSGGLLSGSDWTAVNIESAWALCKVTAVEQQGKVFRRSVEDYMEKSGLASSAVSVFSVISGISSSGELDISSIEKKAKNTASQLEESGGEAGDETVDEAQQQYEASTAEERREARNIFLGMVKDLTKWKRSGLLALVTDDADISDEKYDTKDFPSKLSSSVKKEKHGELSTETVTDKILFREYAVHQLEDYITSKGKDCSLEYVIAGKESDEANMKSVVKKLAALRFAANSASFAASSTMKTKVDTMALLVAGAFGSPELADAVGAVIKAVWVLEETLADVKTLLAGGKVPAAKKTSQWRTSLGMSLKEAYRTDSGDEGLSYEMYLRVLLTGVGIETASYRVMDMLQRKIRNIEPAFSFSNCVYGAKFCTKAGAGSIFPMLPGTVNTDLTQEVAYSYGQINKYIE